MHNKTLILNFFIGIALMLICANCKEPISDITLQEKEYNLDCTLASISAGSNLDAWIGGERGTLSHIKDGKITDYNVGSQRIYKVLPVGGDRLLVGMRNSGLFLIGVSENSKVDTIMRYSIKGKGLEYSPYDFVMSNNRIYVGTSNGLYFTNLPHDEKGEMIEMQHIDLVKKYNIKHVKFYSVVSHGDMIYSACNQGVIAINASADTIANVGVLFKDRCINHISQYRDTVYILDNKGNLYTSYDTTNPIMSFSNSPIVYYEDGINKWGISQETIELENMHTKQRGIANLRKTFSFGKNGSNAQERSVIVSLSDFSFIAIDDAIWKVPHNINYESSSSVNVACVDYKGDIYIVTSENELYRVAKGSHQAEYMMHIDVNKAIGWIGIFCGNIYLHTGDKAYKTSYNSYFPAQELKEIYTPEIDNIQVAYLDISDKAIFFGQKHGLVRYDIECDTFKSLNGGDLNVQSISHLDKANIINIGTLNHGIWQSIPISAGHNSAFVRGVDSIKSVIDIFSLSAEHFFVLTTEKFMESYGKESRTIINNKGLNKLIYSKCDSTLLILKDNGGFYVYDYNKKVLIDSVRFADIKFIANGSIALPDGTALLSSELGSMVYKGGKLHKWIEIQKPNSIVIATAKYGFVVIILIIGIGCGLIAFIGYRIVARYKKNDKIIIKERTDYLKKLIDPVNNLGKEYESEKVQLNDIMLTTHLHDDDIYKNVQDKIESINNIVQLKMKATFESEIESWHEKLESMRIDIKPNNDIGITSIQNLNQKILETRNRKIWIDYVSKLYNIVRLLKARGTVGIIPLITEHIGELKELGSFKEEQKLCEYIHNVYGYMSGKEVMPFISAILYNAKDSLSKVKGIKPIGLVSMVDSHINECGNKGNNIILSELDRILLEILTLEVLDSVYILCCELKEFVGKHSKSEWKKDVYSADESRELEEYAKKYGTLCEIFYKNTCMLQINALFLSNNNPMKINLDSPKITGHKRVFLLALTEIKFVDYIKYLWPIENRGTSIKVRFSELNMSSILKDVDINSIFNDSKDISVVYHRLAEK